MGSTGLGVGSEFRELDRDPSLEILQTRMRSWDYSICSAKTLTIE